MNSVDCGLHAEQYHLPDYSRAGGGGFLLTLAREAVYLVVEMTMYYEQNAGQF